MYNWCRNCFVEGCVRQSLSCAASQSCLLLRLARHQVQVRRVGRFGLAPTQRTKHQHRELAAHMRFCKLRKQNRCLRDLVATEDRGRTVGKKWRLSAQKICEIAFGKCQRRTFLAEKYEVSKQTIRRSLAFTALTVLEVQMKQLSEFKDFVDFRPPDFSAASLSWDETSHTLALDAMDAAGAQVLRHQTSSSWQVMVSKLQLATGWLGGIKLHHEFVLPPLPLSSNSSSSLHCALFNHPLTGPVMKLVGEILQASQWSAWIHETDGHLANEKLHYHLYRQRRPDFVQRPLPLPADAGAGAQYFELSGLTEQVLCQSHQTQLTLVSAVDSVPKCEVTGGKIVPNLFCATLFLRMGGHFVRLLNSVQLLVKEATFFHWDPQPSMEELWEGRRYSDELANYLIDNLRHNSREMSATQGGVALVSDEAVCASNLVLNEYTVYSSMK